MKIRLKTTFKSIEEARKALCQCEFCNKKSSGTLDKSVIPEPSKMNGSERYTISSTEYEGLKWLYKVGARYISRDSTDLLINEVSVWKRQPRWRVDRDRTNRYGFKGRYDGSPNDYCTKFDADIFSFLTPGLCVEIKGVIDTAVITIE